MLVESCVAFILLGELHKLISSVTCHRFIFVSDSLWREKLLNDCGKELFVVFEKSRVAHNTLKVFIRR